MITMYPAKVNSPATKLVSGINAVIDIIPLVDSSVMPAAPNLAAIGTGEDTETILYGSINGNNLETVTRGFQGTAKAWDSGTAVARLFTAYDLDTLRANLATHDPAVTGVHGVGADIVAKVGDIAVDGNLSPAAQDAIAKKHTQGTDTALGAVGTKDPPIDADKTLYRDSAAADALVTSTWTQIKAFLKTYFDTVYRLATADHSHQSAGAQAGKLDHGLALDGLADDDHPQYLKDVVDDATPQLGGDLDAEGHKIHDLVKPYARKTAHYTTTVDDEIIAVGTTFGAVTITLGTAACRAGQIILVKDSGGASATNAITIATEGAELIDGAATDTINRNRFSKQYYSNGTNWFSYSLTDDNDVFGLMEAGVFASLPGAGAEGRLYFATDTKGLWRDTGAGWQEILRGETAIRLAQLAEKSHASLADLGADDHPQYIKHSLATAASDFLVASGAGVFIKKTLAEVKTLLGIAADIATHAAIKSANATLGHVIVEDASKVDVDGNGKLTLGSDVLLEADLENPPTENEAAKAPTSEWAFDHDAAATGVHGAGTGTITPSTTAATTLYVDAGSGSDANAGTSGSPKATIKGALDALPVVIAHVCTICVRGQQNYPENNVALDFSRFNTLAAIMIKAVNANDEDMFDNGVADAGAGNDELDDATKAWAVDQFNGAYIWIYAGTGVGQVREILDTTATKITTTANWTANPDATSYYVIGGGATMTGTGLYHVNVVGKQVWVYGFKHTGSTSYDIDMGWYANGRSWYSYHATSTNGAIWSNYSVGYFYYNYINGGAYGLIIQSANLTPRYNVFYDQTTEGCRVSRFGFSQMGGGTSKNYFFSCPKGLTAETGSGSMNATVQVYSACTVDHSVDANSWET